MWKYIRNIVSVVPWLLVMNGLIGTAHSENKNCILVKNSSMGRHKKLCIDASSKNLENQRCGKGLYRHKISWIDSCGENLGFCINTKMLCIDAKESCIDTRSYGSTHTEEILKNRKNYYVWVDTYVFCVDTSRLCIDTWGFVSIHTVQET